MRTPAFIYPKRETQPGSWWIHAHDLWLHLEHYFDIVLNIGVHSGAYMKSSYVTLEG